jgi:hypothetical protein
MTGAYQQNLANGERHALWAIGNLHGGRVTGPMLVLFFTGSGVKDGEEDWVSKFSCFSEIVNEERCL